MCVIQTIYRLERVECVDKPLKELLGVGDLEPVFVREDTFLDDDDVINRLSAFKDFRDRHQVLTDGELDGYSARRLFLSE